MKTDRIGCVNFNVQLPVYLYFELREFCYKHNKTKKSLIVAALERELSRSTTEAKGRRT